MLVLCASTGQEQSQNGGEQDHLGDADLKFQQQDRGGHANQRDVYKRQLFWHCKK